MILQPDMIARITEAAIDETGDPIDAASALTIAAAEILAARWGRLAAIAIICSTLRAAADDAIVNGAS